MCNLCSGFKPRDERINFCYSRIYDTEMKFPVSQNNLQLHKLPKYIMKIMENIRTEAQYQLLIDDQHEPKGKWAMYGFFELPFLGQKIFERTRQLHRN